MEAAGGLPEPRLIADLNKLRQAAGSPSLSELVRLSQRTLSKSTLHDHLAGRRTRLPPWRLVSAYVKACHAAAARTGLNVEQLGTLEEWYGRWAAAANGAPDSAFADTAKVPILPVSQSRPKLGDTLSSTSIPAVIKRLEDDLSQVGKSLPPYTGLLAVTNGPNIGMRFQIEHNITTIGRDPESDIWLNDPGVSRHHAEIHRRGARFVVNDAGSLNGTFLRQQAIESETLLSSYDELGIAAFTLMFLQSGGETKISRKHYRLVSSRLIEDISASTDRYRAYVERTDDDEPKAVRLWPLRGLRIHRPPK
jgi:hypothetical protein